MSLTLLTLICQLSFVSCNKSSPIPHLNLTHTLLHVMETQTSELKGKPGGIEGGRITLIL
ncbi:hypothetical protein M758_9G110400 [Ceratodon purpureus]|uniref:Uncharacterized protein n=1 Tax=Ceratodon purpureus TaxID=3225 RepID=A0A8T0GS79_CERPU|nr:hypothetical protein KC19_9G095600 [Ceratodon purpureus]KAG0606063.1 hypothetical protein M758_9G110400 [Ceratodon purpureus]